MEEEKDPFEGTATPVGLTFPSVGLRPWIVNSTPQTVDSTPSTANSSHSSVNLTPPRSDSAYGDQEEKDPFEGTATPIGLTPPNSKNVLKIVDVYGNAFSNKFASTSDTSRVEDMSGSSKNMTEEDDMYIIEDPSPNKEKRNILYDLISEAIMETNSGIFTKGFCTLEEIYDYISKLRLIGLSSNWKQEVFEILYEKRTEFIHIPCGTKPFQDGSWTLHPLVAKSHKAVKRSPLKSLRNFSNIPMDCNRIDLNRFPVVRITRCPRIDTLALAYVERKTQVKLSSHFEDGEPVPWGGWGEDQMEQLVKKYNTLDYLIDSVSNNEKLNRSRKSTTLKRTLSESKDTTKRQKVSPKSRRESSPTRKSSLVS